MGMTWTSVGFPPSSNHLRAIDLRDSMPLSLLTGDDLSLTGSSRLCDAATDLRSSRKGIETRLRETTLENLATRHISV